MDEVEQTVFSKDEIRPDRNSIWAFIEEFPEESSDITDARKAARELGVQPVSAHTADLLRVLAASTHAQNILEVGTGTGVSTLALLQGMEPGSAMTTLDIDNSRLQRARLTIQNSSHGRKHRVRTICGDAAEVLPRLSQGSYDLAFVDTSVESAEYSVLSCLSLIKSGGLLIMHNALNQGLVAQPTARDPQTVVHRRLLQEIQECTHDVFVSLVHSNLGLYLVYKR